MAPQLILTYFDFAGLAEPVRMALAMSGLEWEDKRLTGEEFGALKPGECPYLADEAKLRLPMLAAVQY